MSSHVTTAPRHSDLDSEELAVHRWRVMQLTRLGLSLSVAEAVADRVNWHEVAKLVHHGCPPSLALMILE